MVSPMGDYHVHLHEHGPYRGRGPRPGEYPVGLIERYVENAHANGLREVGFTEHLYRCTEAAPILGEFWDAEPRRDLAAETAAMVNEDRILSLEAYVNGVLAALSLGFPRWRRALGGRLVDRLSGVLIRICQTRRASGV